MRIAGVGPQYSDLLEAAGSARRPNWPSAIPPIWRSPPGGRRGPSGDRPSDPSEAEIAGWVADAGSLDSVVEH